MGVHAWCPKWEPVVEEGALVGMLGKSSFRILSGMAGSYLARLRDVNGSLTFASDATHISCSHCSQIEPNLDELSLP